MSNSYRDPTQITQAEHNEKDNAKRVTIVGGDFGIADAVRDSLKDMKFDFKYPEAPKFEYKQPLIIEKEVLVKEYRTLEIPKIIYETKIVEIEKQVIVTDIKVIEVPKIIYEPKIVEIERLVTVTEYKTIEKPVIIEKTNNKVLILFFIGQLLILALSKFVTIP